MRILATGFIGSIVLSTGLLANAISPQEIQEAPVAPFKIKEKTDKEKYQIGEEWGKKVVKKADLEEGTAMHRAAYATARLGGGTSFILGKFNGQMILATNHHVCPGKRSCVGRSARFTLLNKSYRVTKHLGNWSDIDAALLVIDVPNEEDQEELLAVAENFEFNEGVFKGQELVTVGYGIAYNFRRDLVGNQDSDCIVFSDDVRFIPDPDRLNPADYKTWSFANGCDISHGDSGSAMVDRNTGKVVGIIWTGNIPKIKDVLDSSYLKRIYDTDAEDVWQELSYAVAATEIGKKLQEVIDDPETEEETRDILADIVN